MIVSFFAAIVFVQLAKVKEGMEAKDEEDGEEETDEEEEEGKEARKSGKSEEQGSRDVGEDKCGDSAKDSVGMAGGGETPRPDARLEHSVAPGGEADGPAMKGVVRRLSPHQKRQATTSK